MAGSPPGNEAPGSGGERTAGFLVTFRCGDVQHFENAPKAGGWATHWSPLPACQATSRVITVVPCPGCEHCQADNSKERTA